MAVRYGATSSEHLKYKPEEFTWENQEQLDQKTQEFMNRKPFSYDLANDPLYQQYKEQYAAMGNLAMQDTMGQAAALTGGYGNSYAQTAGQQTYQNYLNRVNEVVPDLYARARNDYEAEGERLYKEISLLEGQKAQEYSRYQADLDDWYNYLSVLQSQEGIARENDRWERQFAASQGNTGVASLTTGEYAKWRDLFAAESGNENALLNLRDQLASMGYQDQAFALYYEYAGGSLETDPFLDQLNAGKTIKEIEEERMAASLWPNGKMKTVSDYLNDLEQLRKLKEKK